MHSIAFKLRTGKSKALSIYFVLTKCFLHSKLWQEVSLRSMVDMARSGVNSGKSSQQPMPSYRRKAITLECFLMLLYVRTCVLMDELFVKKSKGIYGPLICEEK